jgi:hypothetical protein
MPNGQTAAEQNVALLAQILQTALASATERLDLTAAEIVSGLATVLMRAAVAAVDLSAPEHATHNRNLILAGIGRVAEVVAATHVEGEVKEIVN